MYGSVSCAFVYNMIHYLFVVFSCLFQQLASHGLLDVHVRAIGDIHIDDHHTNEDVALSIGTVLQKAAHLDISFGSAASFFYFESI